MRGMAGVRDLGGEARAGGRDVPEPGRADGGRPGGSPPCAICARTGGEPRRLMHLTYGVSVWLCQKHAGDGFLRDGDGAVFAERLAAMWLATGSLTARRAAALRAYMRQVQSAGASRDQPGSYSWPALRREAEQRFAAGHDPQRVIQELRDRPPLVLQWRLLPARCDGGTHRRGGSRPPHPVQANPDERGGGRPGRSHSSRMR